MTLHQLPPLPSGIDLLSNTDAEWIDRRYPTAPKSPKKCVTCGGSGKFRWYLGDTDEEVDYECPCEDQWIMHRSFLHAGIGLAYQRMSWRMVAAEKKAVDLAKQWRANADRYINAGIGLIFQGTIGSGKTLLSTLLLKELLADGHDGYFTTFSGMIDEFASGWRDEDQKRWFRERITNADVLVVDDVGRELKQRIMEKGEGMNEKTRPLAVSTMDEVLRYRVAHCKPTIITTNVSDLDEGYGSNIMSLLNERATDYKFTGGDFRDKAYDNQEQEIIKGLVRPVVVS